MTSWWTHEPTVNPVPNRKDSLDTLRAWKKNRTQRSMRRVGFKLATPAFERAKTVHGLDSAAAVIGKVEN
jgi:hypothetical protein